MHTALAHHYHSLRLESVEFVSEALAAATHAMQCMSDAAAAAAHEVLIKLIRISDIGVSTVCSASDLTFRPTVLLRTPRA